MNIPNIKAPANLYKWIWFVTVCVPLGLLKLAEDRAESLQNRLEQCEQNGNVLSELKRKSDSVMMYRLMDEAFKHSNSKILQPAIDSIKKDQK